MGLLYSCQNTSRSAEKTADTAYLPPRASPLPEKEMKHYKTVLSSFFDSMLLGRGFSGGILVAKNGTVLYENYAGFEDVGKQHPISDTSSLHIASTSKTFMGRSSRIAHRSSRGNSTTSNQ